MKVKLTEQARLDFLFRLGYLVSTATKFTTQEIADGAIEFVENLEFEDSPEVVALKTKICQLSGRIEDLEHELEDIYIVQDEDRR